jgi:hypothetical protein
MTEPPARDSECNLQLTILNCQLSIVHLTRASHHQPRPRSLPFHTVRRILFNLAAILSLLLFLVALSLWIRSAIGPIAHYRQTWNEPARNFRYESISLYQGVIAISTVHQHLNSNAPLNSSSLARIRRNQLPWTRRTIAPTSPGPTPSARPSHPAPAFILYSLKIQTRNLGPEQLSEWSLGLRLWPIALAAVAIPALWVARRITRAHRIQIGHCTSCGYDLRATPDRCPECGATPENSRTPEKGSASRFAMVSADGPTTPLNCPGRPEDSGSTDCTDFTD